ncbi:CubicO group peptidase (beta-lactamase class C family) [Metabacillus crassostreae]|uniref:serine hydrolase domain-containing protein n=1 Tax=Metabacillus crassostreae TaxID=929098 RepID=UPI001EF83BCC|nr:serine hydrolase domain-containing protein [Metabacillus crassostreae]MBM7602672.1 CubicO group peptidase (beta-lactamase class C family) [Metabacillus crassostreae]
MVTVFSSTKGFAALAAAIAHSKGYFDYDEKVSSYWKEFGQNGKENITVRQLLNHQAGLSTIKDLPLNKICDFDTKNVVTELEKKEPDWEPGTRHGYHCWTIGWLISELIRRTDPKNRTLKEFFHDEIAKPLNAKFYIGLPDHIDDSRVSTIKGLGSVLDLFKNFRTFPRSLLLAFMNPQSLTSKSMVDSKNLLAHSNFNTREIRKIEFPSGNGIGLVRDMAKIYSEFANGGNNLKLKNETFEELMNNPQPTQLGFKDVVQTVDTAFQVGFFKPIETGSHYGSPKCFGHPGAGGSFCFADPENKVGFAYGMTKVGTYMFDDPREIALRNAFYECL